MTNRRKSSPSSAFQRNSFIAVLLIIVILFLYMVRGFIMPVLIGAIFTGLTYHFYEKILKIVRKPVIASLLCLCIILLVIFIPVSALGFFAYREAVEIVTRLEMSAIQAKLESFFQYALLNTSWLGGLFADSIPGNIESIDYAQLAKSAAGSFKKIIQYLFSGGANLSRSLFGALVTTGLTLFSMFYFYLDGPSILQKIIRLSPLNDEYEKRIFEKFASVTRATLKGTLLIGVAQGAMGGIVIWAVGVPSPVFWFIVMAILSIIPGVGVIVVLLPISIFLFIKGSIISGIIVLAASSIIGVTDNLLRPRLVGKDLKMHDLLILFSTLGGIGMFGLIGFVVGPIIASLFITVLDIYQEMFKKELDQNLAYPKKEGS
jgi:predicted PurR-regulated permease PerM